MKHNAKRSIVALLLAVALVASFAFAGAATLTEKNISVKGGVDIYMDGEAFQPTNVNGDAVEVFIHEGTTYLPIRAIAEALDMVVGFDLESGSVYVNGVIGAAPSAKAAEYIKHYFGVEFNETVTAGEWNAAVATVLGEENPAMTMELAPTMNIAAVMSAVQASGLKQLAETYSEEKAAETLASAGVTFEMPEGDAAAYYACALDANLIAPTLDPTADLTGETATELLMSVAQTSGHGRNYIGRISDADILNKVITACQEITTIDDGGDLAELGPKMVLEEVVTGYGLKYAGYNANFLPEYTIQYGHSSTAHAVQLVALMASEGIDAYIQIEPKTSVFVYGNVIYSNEYDMQIEFDTTEDKLAFDALIKAYAQKFPENQNEDGSFSGLLSGAWWTPLYSSSVEVDENYGKMYNNIIAVGDYEIHTFSTEEGVTEVAEYVKASGVEAEITVVPRYANMAFAKDYLPTGATVLGD